jgi:hypothetical protein
MFFVRPRSDLGIKVTARKRVREKAIRLELFKMLSVCQQIEHEDLHLTIPPEHATAKELDFVIHLLFTFVKISLQRERA